MKAENDDRFMNERDAARAQLANTQTTLATVDRENTRLGEKLTRAREGLEALSIYEWHDMPALEAFEQVRGIARRTLAAISDTPPAGHAFAECIKADGDKPCRDCVQYAHEAVGAPPSSPNPSTPATPGTESCGTCRSWRESRRKYCPDCAPPGPPGTATCEPWCAKPVKYMGWERNGYCYCSPACREAGRALNPPKGQP